MTAHNLFEYTTLGENVNKSMISNDLHTLKAIDLFAGIGGIRRGFSNIFKHDIQFVFSSEIDNHAQKTYYFNYNELPYGDITKIDEAEIPPHDIILAGFPCQAFSVAGYRKGFEDTRGTLFFDVARIAAYHKPKVIFLENVKGFVGHDNGNTFKTVKKTLKDMGYTVFHKVLNTKDFNVPQNRERIYIIAFLDNEVSFNFPKSKESTKTIKDLLDKKVDQYFYYNDKPLYSKIKDDVVSDETVYQWRRKYVRENKNSLCPTLTANMGTGGHNVPIVKDAKGIRKLTPAECVKFQGFDDSFKFPKDLALSHQYKQAGNSVTVNVIEALAQEIKNVL
jgi:DNA (cytosine-5)-methyltransferase 1